MLHGQLIGFVWKQYKTRSTAVLLVLYAVMKVLSCKEWYGPRTPEVL